MSIKGGMGGATGGGGSISGGGGGLGMGGMGNDGPRYWMQPGSPAYDQFTELLRGQDGLRGGWTDWFKRQGYIPPEEPVDPMAPPPGPEQGMAQGPTDPMGFFNALSGQAMQGQRRETRPRQSLLDLLRG